MPLNEEINIVPLVIPWFFNSSFSNSMALKKKKKNLSDFKFFFAVGTSSPCQIADRWDHLDMGQFLSINIQYP